MRVPKRCIFIVSVALMLVVGLFTHAFALQLLDRKLEISGFLENSTGVHLEDNLPGYSERGDLSMSRSTFQLEGNYGLTETTTLHGIGRFYYEGSFDLDTDIDQRPRDAMLRGEDLGALYVNVHETGWNLRVGKQQVIWGESDGLRMSDIINPLDYSWHYIFESWEDIRIPLWMVDFDLKVPGTKSSFVELVWVPADFRATEVAPDAANWAFPSFVTPTGLEYDFYNKCMKLSEPDNHSLKSGEGGIRYKTQIGAWDIAIFDYYSRNDLPVVREDWGSRLVQSGFAPTDIFEYKYVNKAGGSFNVHEDRWTGTVFRGELAYSFGDPMNDRSLTRIYEKDTLAYMLGFDRPTTISFLNPAQSFFISGQIFQKWILNWKDSDDIFTGDLGHNKSQTILSLLINTSYINGKLSPQVFVVYDIEGDGWVQPQVSYELSRAWHVALGANLMWSNHTDFGYFGPFEKNDEAYLRVKYSF